MSRRIVAVKGGVSAAQRRRLREQQEKSKLIEDESSLRPFTRDIQVYNPDSKEEQYRTTKGEFKNVVKWGQRKLTITLIQFFTLHWNPTKHPRPKALYIGAAPGCSINVAAELFPEIEWHLYDSAPFNRKLPKNVKV